MKDKAKQTAEGSTSGKKKWLSPKVQVLEVNSDTADGTMTGAETVMMGMLSPGS